MRKLRGSCAEAMGGLSGISHKDWIRNAINYSNQFINHIIIIIIVISHSTQSPRKLCGSCAEALRKQLSILAMDILLLLLLLLLLI